MKTIIACIVAIAAVHIVPEAWPGIFLALVGIAILDLTGQL